MFIKLIYKKQTKKLVFGEELYKYEVLEQKAIKLFSFQKHKIMLYYIDNDGEKIVIMEDKDIKMMIENFQEKENFYEIYVQNDNTNTRIPEVLLNYQMAINEDGNNWKAFSGRGKIKFYRLKDFKGALEDYKQTLLLENKKSFRIQVK